MLPTAVEVLLPGARLHFVVSREDGKPDFAGSADDSDIRLLPASRVLGIMRADRLQFEILCRVVVLVLVLVMNNEACRNSRSSQPPPRQMVPVRVLAAVFLAGVIGRGDFQKIRTVAHPQLTSTTIFRCPVMVGEVGFEPTRGGFKDRLPGPVQQPSSENGAACESRIRVGGLEDHSLTVRPTPHMDPKGGFEPPFAGSEPAVLPG